MQRGSSHTHHDLFFDAQDGVVALHAQLESALVHALDADVHAIGVAVTALWSRQHRTGTATSVREVATTTCSPGATVHSCGRNSRGKLVLGRAEPPPLWQAGGAHKQRFTSYKRCARTCGAAANLVARGSEQRARVCNPIKNVLDVVNTNNHVCHEQCRCTAASRTASHSPTARTCVRAGSRPRVLCADDVMYNVCPCTR